MKKIYIIHILNYNILRDNKYMVCAQLRGKLFMTTHYLTSCLRSIEMANELSDNSPTIFSMTDGHVNTLAAQFI